MPLDQLMATSREKGRDVPTVIEKATEWIIMNGTSLSLTTQAPRDVTRTRSSTHFTGGRLIRHTALAQEGIFRKAGRLDSIEDYKDLFNQGT
jgi:hypothetical protein